jgi:hypothetical protein
MNTLQQKFDSILNENVGTKSIIEAIIRRKFREASINLSETQLHEIVSRIDNLKDGENSIDTNDIVGENSDVKIVITDDDINETINSMKTAVRDEYPGIIENLAEILLKQIKRTARSQVRGHRKDRKKFEKRLEKLWRLPLRLLETFQLLVVEAGDEFNRNYRPTASSSRDLVFDVLTRLHARACQISTEVIVLLKAGLADGAHARWRTLHEVGIVAMFIEKHGPNVADRYLSHAIVDSHKGAAQYRRHHNALGLEAFPDDEFHEIESEYQEALTRFGNAFKTDYGWASEALKNNKPTFADIEENVDLEKWRGHYKMASHNVHAGAKGILFKLGLGLKPSEILLAGSSNSGLADPAHGTALSLLQITSTLLFTKPNIDTLVRCRILMELQREIGEEFLKVHNQIEDYEASHSDE